MEDCMPNEPANQFTRSPEEKQTSTRLLSDSNFYWPRRIQFCKIVPNVFVSPNAKNQPSTVNSLGTHYIRTSKLFIKKKFYQNLFSSCLRKLPHN